MSKVKELLSSYKKSNRDRRAKLLAKWGYKSEEAFYKEAGVKDKLSKKELSEVVRAKESLQYIKALDVANANRFYASKTINMTEAAKTFLEYKGVTMVVNFNKKLKEDDVVNSIMSFYNNSTPRTMELAIRSGIKSILEGKERTIIGKHRGNLNEFGRVLFTDLEIPEGVDKESNLRQVDLRGLNYFICSGVKYIVK